MKIYFCAIYKLDRHKASFIWQYKENFHKTITGISKSLFFLFHYILESSVD